MFYFIDAKRAGSAEKAAEQLKQTSIFSKKMPEVEARQVLNISDVVTRQEVEDQFERLFTANDVEKGGSFYLQSKVYRARESVLEAMGETVDVPALLMDKEAIESSQTNKPSEEKEQEQKNKS